LPTFVAVGVIETDVFVLSSLKSIETDVEYTLGIIFIACVLEVGNKCFIYI
jgi:hypothetical protein